MICRNCGTEIADRAIVCYRCGTATAEPRTRPPAESHAPVGRLPAGVAIVLLVLAGLFMGQAGASAAVPDAVGWILLTGGLGLLGWQVARRRRRR